MPRAKRALKLENLIPEKVPATSSVKEKKNGLLFSPITGTCLMSPFSSPRSNHAKKQRNDLSNVLSSCRNNAKESDEIGKSSKVLPIQSNRKEEHQLKNNDKLLVLQSEVEHSLERFLQIRKKLTNLKALEGTGELDNILGTSNKSGNLKIEVRKSRQLISSSVEQVRPRNLQKSGAVGLSIQDNLQPANSFTFLKSLIG